MKNILFAAFESLPFVKVGGLADVVYALPKAINNKKYKVKVVLPLFKTIKTKYKSKLKYLDSFKIKSGVLKEDIKVYSYVNEKIEYLFIGCDKYYDRDNVYSYKDDIKRYAVFNLAVVQMLFELNYYPDIIHVHDYHTSMIPAICKLKYKDDKKISKIKHILTIHNLVFQGGYDKKVLFDYYEFDPKDYKNGNLRFKDYCNFMKNGICLSDAVTTVSKTYVKEIQTKKYGCGLENILKKNKDKLYGIVNGIDITLFNPKKDKDIYYNYDIKNYKIGKKENKLFLQKKLGLKQDENVFLVGMVSRLTSQKGADLMLASMDKILKTNVQIVILGTGEKQIEKDFTKLSKANKNRFAYYCGYNESLAHQIYSSIDMLFMPSSFEPCGISQLISMRYGTLPLVRKTGGLNDTVINVNRKNGNGFVFEKYSANEFYKTYKLAYDIYYNDHKNWDKLILNAMHKDVSFDKSAREYETIYQKVLKK